MERFPISLRIIGCPNSGRRTIAGCLLYKFNGITLMGLEKLQAQGRNTYRDVVEGLQSQGVQPRFESPKHFVSIIDGDSNEPDIWLAVVAPDDDAEKLAENLTVPIQARVIVLVTKMDKFGWSEHVFEEKVVEISKLGYSATFLPCSGLSGDNFVELSPKTPWYASRFASTGGSVPEYGTLLAAIDQTSFPDST